MEKERPVDFDAGRMLARIRELADPSLAEIELPKVAVTGAPCSGKSTAIEEVARSLHGRVRHAEEQARILFDGVAIPDRMTVPAQASLAEAILHEERRASKAGLPIVADRTIVDGAVFVRWSGDQDGARRLVEAVRPWLLTYDHLLLCSPDGIPYQADRVRTETPEQRDAIHQAFLEALEEYEIEYDLLEGTRKERHDEIVAIVDGLSSAP